MWDSDWTDFVPGRLPFLVLTFPLSVVFVEEKERRKKMLFDDNDDTTTKTRSAPFLACLLQFIELFSPYLAVYISPGLCPIFVRSSKLSSAGQKSLESRHCLPGAKYSRVEIGRP